MPTHFIIVLHNNYRSLHFFFFYSFSIITIILVAIGTEGIRYTRCRKSEVHCVTLPGHSKKTIVLIIQFAVR